MLTIAVLIAAWLLAPTGRAESAQEPVTENPALTSPVPAGMLRGTVLETMDAAGYTYVFVDTDRDKRWMATRQTAVQVGDTVQASQGIPMSDFESTSLKRTFDLVYFVGSLENLSNPASPAGQPGGRLPAGHPSIGRAVETPAANTHVAELKPGQNIAYVYANRESLAGRQVSLRGKVVKYNADILGWNFIHIQDGSGDAADASKDLTVTSKAATTVGDTVVVTGTIILNKDFGYGYDFPVMMEGAEIGTE